MGLIIILLYRRKEIKLFCFFLFVLFVFLVFVFFCSSYLSSQKAQRPGGSSGLYVRRTNITFRFEMRLVCVTWH